MLREKSVNKPRSTQWPYDVDYYKESDVYADVLILGGGIAGCHAAINASRAGAKVVIVEKASVIRSGSGGSGVDHWHNAYTNPCSKITPDEVTELRDKLGLNLPEGYGSGHVRYIEARESYDALLDMEKMGMKIRDVNDEFVGAEFRDNDTKLMFAYDYENKHVIRVPGANVKLILYRELKRLGVKIYDRVMSMSLLTADGRPGARVIGATGVNTRTGEFYVFKSKATILCTAEALRIWAFSMELQGLANEHNDPNNSGDGCAMAWQAGAEFALMERSMRLSGGFRYPAYGTGNASNTWFACNIVDARGKEIPWVNRDGQVLKTISERYRPAPGQKYTLHDPASFPTYEIRGASLIPDLSDRIIKGEFVLPFYADLPSMPEHERRAIFGLMIGNEGKTRIPIYYNYTKAGFNPDEDMLQANVLPPRSAGPQTLWWQGVGPPQWRGVAFVFGGGLLVDWDLRTNLQGLYAAGNQVMGTGTHTMAATTGRYVGRTAAAYSKIAEEPVVSKGQILAEKARVYAPVKQNEGLGWKELQSGISRIMQDYCGEYKSEDTLKLGLKWLKSFRESEIPRACARNPHELWRTLEVMSRLTTAEIIINSCLARRASSACLDFKRIDYPDDDPPGWRKFVTIKLKNGKVKVGYLPLKYWLLPPYLPTYLENYEQHSLL